MVKLNPKIHKFKIYLVEGKRIKSGLYNYEEFLNSAKLKEILINEDDIETYNWDSQEIILNKIASDKIRKKYSRFDLEVRQFIVLFKEKRIFGGIILDLGSARGIDYPVIYLPNLQSSLAAKENIIIKIRPYHNFGEDNFSKKERIENEEIKNYFININKIR